MMLILIALAVLALVAWLALTWYNQPDSITFKMVVQSVFQDTRDIVRPVLVFFGRLWGFYGPRITNISAIAVVSLDAYVVQTPELKLAIMSTPYGLCALVAINLAARLSPHGAPASLPSSSVTFSGAQA